MQILTTTLRKLALMMKLLVETVSFRLRTHELYSWLRPCCTVGLDVACQRLLSLSITGNSPDTRQFFDGGGKGG